MTRPWGKRTIRSTVGTLRELLQVKEHERGAVVHRMGVSVAKCQRSQSPKQGDIRPVYIVGGGRALVKSSTPCQVLKPVIR